MDYYVAPSGILKEIFPEPNVGLTSSQAVNLNFYAVFRSIWKIDQYGPWRDSGGPFLGKGSLKSASEGQF